MKFSWQALSKSSFIQDAFFTYLARGFCVLFGTLTTIVVSRAVGPEGRGWMACALSLASFWFPIASFGLNISNYVLGSKWIDKRPQLVSNSIYLSIVSTLLLSAIILPLEALYPSVVPLPGIFLAGAIFYSFVLTLSGHFQSLLFSFGKVRICNWQEFCCRGLCLLSVTILFLIHCQAASQYFLIQAFILFLGVIFYSGVIWRFLGRFSQGSWQLFRTSALCNFKGWLYTIAGSLFTMTDIFIISYLSGPAQVGYYNIAAAIVRNVFIIIPSTLSQLLLPKLATSCKTIRDCLPRVRFLSLILIVINLTLIATLSLITPWLINFTVGPQFSPCVQVIYWILPGAFFYAQYCMLGPLFNVAGCPYSTTVCYLVAVCADWTLCFLWGAKGAIGAAQAFSCASGLLLLSALVQVGLYATTKLGDAPLVMGENTPELRPELTQLES